MAVLKTTSPPTDPAAPNARPNISVPSSSNSFIATGAFMRGPQIELSGRRMACGTAPLHFEKSTAFNGYLNQYKTQPCTEALRNRAHRRREADKRVQKRAIEGMRGVASASAPVGAAMRQNSGVVMFRAPFGPRS